MSIRFELLAHRRRRPARPLAHAARRRRDAGVHARRHAGHRQGPDAATSSRDAGAQIILGNTYHLALRPGDELIAELGGLHRFMGWDGPILTDSGGFQVYSLAPTRKITDHAAVFRSHIDGALLELTPERAVAIQENLGSDIAMCLDECPPADTPPDYLRDRRAAHDPLGRALPGGPPPAGPGAVRHRAGRHRPRPARPLRRGAGGARLSRLRPGRLQRRRDAGRRWSPPSAPTAALLPADKPRYLMGVGRPQDILAGVAAGIDMFDCVLPTRNGRNASAFTADGRAPAAQRLPQARSGARWSPIVRATPAATSAGRTCTTCSWPRRCSGRRCCRCTTWRFTAG